MLLKIMCPIFYQEKIIICQEERPRQTEEGVHILPWQEALKILFR